MNWRLGNRESPLEPSFPSERRQSIAGGGLPAAAAAAAAAAGGAATGGAVGGTNTSSDTDSNTTNTTTATTTTNLDPRETFRPRARSNLDPEAEPKEIQNARALQVLSRVNEKLTGTDFRPDEELSVPEQVDKLLIQATNLENLCQHYIGWCSFW